MRGLRLSAFAAAESLLPAPALAHKPSDSYLIARCPAPATPAPGRPRGALGHRPPGPRRRADAGRDGDGALTWGEVRAPGGARRARAGAAVPAHARGRVRARDQRRRMPSPNTATAPTSRCRWRSPAAGAPADAGAPLRLLFDHRSPAPGVRALDDGRAIARRSTAHAALTGGRSRLARPTCAAHSSSPPSSARACGTSGAGSITCCSCSRCCCPRCCAAQDGALGPGARAAAGARRRAAGGDRLHRRPLADAGAGGAGRGAACRRGSSSRPSPPRWCWPR